MKNDLNQEALEKICKHAKLWKREGEWLNLGKGDIILCIEPLYIPNRPFGACICTEVTYIEDGQKGFDADYDLKKMYDCDNRNFGNTLWELSK